MVKPLLLPLAFLGIPISATAQSTSVIQFGAHPDDGATDSTVAIQSAINAARGGRVYLPQDIAGLGAEIIASVQDGSITGLRIANPSANYCKAPEIVLTAACREIARSTAR